jgi:hypothetical protein
VAQSIGISRPTVWRWKQRFAKSRVEGLLRDKTRKPGKAPIRRNHGTGGGVELRRAAAPGDPLNRSGDGQSDWHLGGFAVGQKSVM